MTSARTPRRKGTTRRPRHRHSAARHDSRQRRRLGWLLASALVCGIVGWAVLARALAPLSNTSRTRFDAIVVLGTKSDSDGNPTPRQLARVNEGVAEYERGVAPHLIFSGGAVGNQFVEADGMARAAEAEGIPASAILEDTESRDTIHNACDVARLMRARNWRSAEVISSASHLPRAALVFRRLPLDWRMHAAPSMEPANPADRALAASIETLKTVYYLLYSSWAERCTA